MIAATFALEQVRRLGQLDFYPKKDDAAIKELVKAAMTADTELILIKTVDCFVFDGGDCPKPADIFRTIARMSEKTYTLAPTKCELCGDSGFMQMRVEVGGRVYEGATPCNCRASQKATA